MSQCCASIYIYAVLNHEIRLNIVLQHLFRNILRAIREKHVSTNGLAREFRLNVTRVRISVSSCNIIPGHGAHNISTVSRRKIYESFEGRVWNSVICEVSSHKGESAEGQLFRIEGVRRDAYRGRSKSKRIFASIKLPSRIQFSLT